MITSENFYKNKWSAVVDTTRAGAIILHICKIKTHAKEREGDGALYLGKVENFLAYNVGSSDWEYNEEEDLSKYVFPFKHDQVFDTEKEAKKSLIIQLFSIMNKI